MSRNILLRALNVSPGILQGFDMRKRFFTIVSAVILLAACGSGGAESGIEVRKVKMGAGAQGEDRAVYLAMQNHGSEVVDMIPVYANTEFVFIPDAYHVMLVGLKQDLHVGDEIEIALHFRDHKDMTISVPVGEATEHEH